jgi:hypothetical protein
MGEIVDFVIEEKTTEDDEKKMPIIKFKDKTGVVFQFESGISSSEDYFKGQRVTVRYLANDPNKAMMANSFSNIWLPSIVTLILGFFFTLISVVCNIFGRKGNSVWDNVFT